jgi:hypothetical protein
METEGSAWLPGGFCSADWRWQRACWLQETGQRPDRRLDDAWVARVRHFLDAAGGGPDGADPGRADRRDPAIANALQLSRADPPFDRWRLEAYLLTAEPLEAVARHCALSVEAVEAYHALLFDVRPRLTARDWIAARALCPGPGNGFVGEQPGRVWRVCAYAAGPRVLEVVMAVTMNRPLPDWVHAPGGRLTPEREARLRLSCKLLVTALTTPSAEVLRALVAIAGQARTLAADAAGPPARAASRLPAMHDFLQGLGRRPRPARRRKRVGPPSAEANAGTGAGAAMAPRPRPSAPARGPAT